MEDTRLNYVEMHAERLGLDAGRLEGARVAAAQGGPAGETLDLCARCGGAQPQSPAPLPAQRAAPPCPPCCGHAPAGGSAAPGGGKGAFLPGGALAGRHGRWDLWLQRRLIRARIHAPLPGWRRSPLGPVPRAAGPPPAGAWMRPPWMIWPPGWRGWCAAAWGSTLGPAPAGLSRRRVQQAPVPAAGCPAPSTAACCWQCRRMRRGVLGARTARSAAHPQIQTHVPPCLARSSLQQCSRFVHSPACPTPLSWAHLPACCRSPAGLAAACSRWRRNSSRQASCWLGRRPACACLCRACPHRTCCAVRLCRPLTPRSSCSCLTSAGCCPPYRPWQRPAAPTAAPRCAARTPPPRRCSAATPPGPAWTGLWLMRWPAWLGKGPTETTAMWQVGGW